MRKMFLAVVTIMLAGNAFAWKVDTASYPKTSDSVHAYVNSSSNSTLSIACYPAQDHCEWDIVTDKPCERNKLYPVTIRRNNGTDIVDIRARCERRMVIGDIPYYKMSIEDLSDIVMSASYVEIEMQHSNQRTIAHKFNTSGASQSVQTVFDKFMLEADKLVKTNVRSRR